MELLFGDKFSIRLIDDDMVKFINIQFIYLLKKLDD